MLQPIIVRRLGAVAGLSVALIAAAATGSWADPVDPTPAPTLTPAPTPTVSPSAETSAPPAERQTPASPEKAVDAPKAPPVAPGKSKAEEPKSGTAVIKCRVWDDEKQDGIRQDCFEKGVERIAVRLYQPGPDGKEVEEKTHTFSDGSYEFRDVKPGTARLEVEGRSLDIVDKYHPLEFVKKGQGKDRTLDSDVTAEQGTTWDGKTIAYGHVRGITVKPGTTTVLDAGTVEPGAKSRSRATITGRVWHDKNRNGLQDKGEPGVKGVPVGIVHVGPKPGDILVGGGSVWTDQQGRYTLCALYPGSVRFDVDIDEADPAPKTPWQFTVAGAGSDRAKDSDVVEAKVPVGVPDNVQRLGLGPVVTLKGDQVVTFDAGLHQNEPIPPAPDKGAAGEGKGRGGSLPVTGSSLGALIGAGVLLLGSGAGAVALTRRRRSTTA